MSRKTFALTVGALGMLLEGVKLLFTNWRLTLIQVLPAMWIWAAMYDLKLHLLSRNSFHVLHGPVVIPIVLAIAAVTAASFFLNAVFAYAIARPGRPRIRPAFTQARSHLVVVLGSGTVVGVLLGVATMVVSRWGAPWFTLSLGIVIAVMMICYVAVPARLIGAKTTSSKRDSLTASMVGGAIGAVVCTPPYVLGRLGLLMLGSHTLFALGVIVFALGLILQAGATGAVKVIKMSAKLVSGSRPRCRSPGAAILSKPRAASGYPGWSWTLAAAARIRSGMSGCAGRSSAPRAPAASQPYLSVVARSHWSRPSRLTSAEVTRTA